MVKKLVIVESPTKTKTISKILGKDYQVLASKGHLRDLPKSQFGVDIENGFEPKYINVRGRASTINELKRAADKADKVYLATDPDREGEAISWHLGYLLNLNINDKNRVEFHEITSTGIKEGMKNPRKIDMDLVDSQQARRVMDRIVGYKISPILWKKVKSGLSAGRVQSVALKLIVDRENEIKAFIPQEYWTIHAHHIKEGIKFESEYYGDFDDKGKLSKRDISNEEEAKKILENCTKEFSVTEVEKKKRSKKPYAPFTTSTLQQEASKRLNFSTSKTMKVAQELYEGISIGSGGQVGLITYMRTDSTRLSKQFQEEAKNFITGAYGKEYATNGIMYGGKKANSQDAHEAVRPSSALRVPKDMEKYLSKDQFKLYDLIWRRAVASQMKSAEYLSTLIHLRTNKSEFRVGGTEIVFEGFQKVWSVKDSTEILPSIATNEFIRVTKFDKKQHFTQPPARFTEASLVQILEENGIGRPSTYASIIKSILSRNYVKIEKKQFYPTELGENVNKLLIHNFPDIINEKFTAQMENSLDEVADGDIKWQDLMNKFYTVFSKDLEKAQEDENSYKVQAVKTGNKCPKCGSDLIIRHGRNGEFIGCSAYPNCNYTESIIVKTGVKCPKCGGDIVEKVSKRGKLFYGCSNYPNCDYASWDKPTGEICKVCGDLMVHRKNRFENRILCHNEECETNKSKK